MIEETIFHLPKTNYSYALNENEVQIRIKLSKNKFKKVNVIYGDKYKWHKKKKLKLKKVLTDYLYDYYQSVLDIESRRISYYFELIDFENKSFYFTEYGIFENETFLNNSEFIYFEFPFINKVDVHKKPQWVDEAIFYQIFPDRFYNKDNGIRDIKLDKWGSKPKYDNFMGGNLNGIRDKIPYFKELGINTIYLTPIFKSNSNHKYDTIDYYEIDPLFGTKEDFHLLVKELHKNNMKIILDAVFNHSSIDFFAFKDVCEKGEKSKYVDWFYIRKLPVNLDKILKKYNTTKDWKNWYLDKNGNNIMTYETFAFYPYMPKLNTENKELKKYLIDVGKYWIREYNIDGWRLDVANEIDHAFWRDFRKEIKEIDENLFIIGEVWHNAEAWLRGDQFDSIMNYGISNIIKWYFGQDRIDKNDFVKSVNEILMRNTNQVNEMMINMLDSHDTPRYYTEIKNKKSKLLLSYAFLITFVGIPMIYYGDEIGIKGGKDPDCRKCFDWNEDKWDFDILDTIKSLIKIRKESNAIKKGLFKWVDLNNELLCFSRKYKKEKIIVIINNNNSKISYKLKGKYIDLISRNDKDIESINGNSFKILKKII